MSNISKALNEVWEWKDKIHEERKGMMLSEWVQISKENGSRIRKKYGIRKIVKTTEMKKAIGA